MKWVLIIMLFGQRYDSGRAIDHVLFETFSLCDSAAVIVAKSEKPEHDRTHAFCVRVASD